jgi:hypothetical protein
MTYLSVRIVLAATLVAAFPGVVAAQFPPPPPPPGSPPASPPTSPPSTVQNRWPEPTKPPQAGSNQKPAQPAAPKRQPAQAKPAPAGAASQAPAQKPKPVSAANMIACSGVFAKDSGHLKLALKYDSRNVTFGPVDGSDGSKINASILFPNDPKRRLEVVWTNEAARSDTSVIAINGKSQWIAPKGLKLGLSIAALEKLNGRPFKLTGFVKDGSASVVGWEGGALASLPGGCKVGVRLFADAKAPETARNAVSGDKEFLSNDAGMRAVKATIGEILIGY